MREIASPLSGPFTTFGQTPIDIYKVGAYRPELAYSFYNEYYRRGRQPVNFLDAITHNRNGNATMTDSSGNIVWAPHNLLTYSEDFSSWPTKTRLSVSSNAVTAPDGLTTADKLVCDNTASSTHWVGSNSSGSTSGDVITLSVFLKAGEFDYAAVYSGAAGKGKYFDLANGVVLGNLISAPTSATMTSFGDGWYLCQITVTAAGDEPLQIYMSSNGTSIIFDGDGTSGIYVWGAHLYRSDLGGMADVPADERVLPTATKYVRTAGRVIGPELVSSTAQSGAITQTASSEGAPWWTAEGTGQWSISGDALTRPAGGTWESLRRDLGMEANKTYRLTFDLVAISGSVSVYRDYGTVVLVASQTGSYEADFTPVGVNASKIQFSSSSLDGTISNISVREIDVDPSAARYLPRVNHHAYNGSQWVNKGLLVESEARTNLFTYSNESFSTPTGLTYTYDDVVSPSGLADGVTLTTDTSTGIHVLPQGYSFTSGTTYTASYYVKKGTQRYISIEAGNPATWDATVIFDLDNGSVDTETNGFGVIEDVGNGWYRCAATGDALATAATNINLYILDGSKNKSWTGTGAEITYVAHRQLEAGSTPSSYIPTNGASVTRPAETITIPAANLPWPSPVVISEELFASPTLEGSGTVVDTGGGSYDFSWSSGATASLVVPNVLTVGSVYEVTFTVSNHVSGALAVSLQAFANGGSYNSDGTYTVYVVAASGDDIRFDRSGSTGSFTVSNISVKEISPLALSIQMKGEMTYADEGAYNQIYFARWQADANNYISLSVNTYLSQTGQPRAFQAASGVVDIVDGGTTYYSPDINVPFNIASRHGSTFINGAVDGVALTEDTTPVALPDLENTDLELAYDFMGTISLFRIWANDLGDTGIEEATEPSTQATLFLSFDGTENSYVNFDWSE